MLRKVNAMLSKAGAFAPASDLVFRIMFSLSFIVGGLGLAVGYSARLAVPMRWTTAPPGLVKFTRVCFGLYTD